MRYCSHNWDHLLMHFFFSCVKNQWESISSDSTFIKLEFLKCNAFRMANNMNRLSAVNYRINKWLFLYQTSQVYVNLTIGSYPLTAKSKTYCPYDLIHSLSSLLMKPLLEKNYFARASCRPFAQKQHAWTLYRELRGATFSCCEITFWGKKILGSC